MNAWPDVGQTRVVRIPTVVELPAPFGARRQKISPGRISSEMPSSAVICGLGCLLFPPGARKEKPPPPAATGGGRYRPCAIRRYESRLTWRTFLKDPTQAPRGQRRRPGLLSRDLSIAGRVDLSWDLRP